MKFKEIAKKVNASIVFVLLTMLGVSSLNEGYSFKVEENKEQKIIKNNNVNTPLSGSPSYYTVSSGIYALNCDGCSVVIDKDATSGETVAYYDSNSDGVADLDTNGNKKLISNTVVDGSNTLTISTATNRSVYGFQTTVATGNYGTAGTKTLVTMLDGTISTLAGCSSASGTGLTSSFDNDFYVDMRGGSITKILSPAVWCTFNGNYNLKISGTATIVPSVNGYYMDHDGTMKATTSSVVSISGSPKIGSTVYGIKIATFDNGVANLVGDIASDAIIYVDLGSADVSGTNNLAKNTGSYTVNKTSFRVCNCSQYACTVSYNSGTSMYYFEYKEGIPEATFVQAKNTLSNLIVGGKYEVTFSDSTTETIPTLAETSYAFATTDYGKKVTQIVKKGLTAAEATAPTYTTDTSVAEQITYNFTALKQGIIYKAVFLDTTDPIYFTADDGTTTHSIVRGSNKTANQRTLSSVTTMAKADSDPQVVDFSLLNKAVLTGITFDETEATFSGLVKGKTYDIMKSHEKFTSFTATDTSMDLSSLAAGVDPISFDALVLEGDNTTNINSDEFSLTGTIYPREPTPTSTYDAYNKGIKDLVASAGYNLIDKDGTTLGQTADATGFISIDTEFWKDSVVAKVIKQGTTGSTLDSLPQIVSYSLLPQESVAGITFTSSNASLNGLTIGKNIV